LRQYLQPQGHRCGAYWRETQLVELKRNMDKVFPQLRDARIDYAWSGYFALFFSRVS
jgi:glycine/D-amino acid oxidase-like deaminating enzyme